jgi:hypothetical protein
MEFGLIIGFTEHSKLVTINDYNTLTNLHILQITVTTAHIKSSLAIAW